MIDPCAIAFTPLGGEGNLLTNLPTIMQTSQFAQQEEHWNAVQGVIVDGMVSLVPNFPPQRDGYTREELREFIDLAGFSQLVLRAEAFVQDMLRRHLPVDLDAFPSLKASLYTAFHKFYVDKSRKPSTSDAFDVIIAASLPYVEAVITENHQAEVLRKTKRRDGFLDHLRVFTLRDFREAAA
jgi:hypothetical protein